MAMDVGSLYSFVLGLVLVGLVIGVGMVVLSEFQDSFITGVTNCGLNSTGGSGAGVNYAACGSAYNATAATLNSIAELPSTWLGLLVTIVVVAIILTIVIRSFGGARR